MSEVSESHEPGGPAAAARRVSDGPNGTPREQPIDPDAPASPHPSRLHPGKPSSHLPRGVGASLVTSGGLILGMVEDLRMRNATAPEDLRPLADTFARHCAAKEATVLKVLERHGAASTVVKRDRQEGELLQGILDRAPRPSTPHRHPAAHHRRRAGPDVPVPFP